MHTHGVKAGLVKRRCHLHMTVDSLFAQHGYLRPHAGFNQRRSHIVLQIKTQPYRQSRILSEKALKLLTRTIGVVAQRLQLIAGLTPETLQNRPRLIKNYRFSLANTQAILVVKLTDIMYPGAETGFGIQGQESLAIFAPHL